jgi:hypothetical protein
MADDSEDPDIKAGREIAAGRKAAATAAGDDDPDIVAGRRIAATPATITTTGPATRIEQPGQGMTWRGTVREIAGALPRIAGSVVDVLSDPYANLVARPLLVAGQTAYDFVAPHMGYNRLTPEDRNALYEDFGAQPGTRAIQTAGQTIGADPYNIQGTTPAEKFVGNVVQGAGTAAALGPRGLAAPTAGAGAATGGQIAAENVADWLKPGAELAGSIAGAKAGNMVTNIYTKGVNTLSGTKTPVVAAYDELGIDKTLLGDVSENPTARLVQAYGSKSPFGASVVHPVEQKVVGQFNQAVEDTAKRLGPSTSEQTAGEVLQKEARNWKDVVFPQRQAQAWQPVDQLLGQENVAPTNYRAALTSLTQKLSALPETAKVLIPQKTWDMLDAINKDVPAGQAMPWQQAQALRTAIGQVMGVPEIVQSLGKDQLKRAYAGISGDMQDTARAVDVRNTAAAQAQGVQPPPSAVAAFDKANRVSTEGHAFIENTLSKIIKSNNPLQDKDPELATRSILGSTDTTLEAIRRELPGAANEVAAYKLRDMALATPGASGRTGQETSVGTFLTDLNRFRQQNPAGFRALFSDPAVARKIEALAIVADTMKETARRANTSGTGPYQAMGEAGSAALATWLATHSPTATALSVAGPFALNRAAGHIVTNPVVTRWASAPGANMPNPFLTGTMVDNEEQRRRNAANPLSRP